MCELLLVVVIPHNRIKVTVSEVLALSQRVPESLSPVNMLSEVVPESLRPVKSLPVCLPMSLLTAGLVESLYSLYNRIARMTLPTSWVVFNSDVHIQVTITRQWQGSNNCNVSGC